MQARGDSGSDQGSGSGGGKKWSDYRDILKVESVKPAVRLGVSCERKKRVMRAPGLLLSANCHLPRWRKNM